MARLWSSGHELNYGTSQSLEWTSVNTAPGTTNVRSSTYAWGSSPTGGNESISYDFATSASVDGYYFRAYIYIVAAPSAQYHLMRTLANTTERVGIKINTDRTLELWNNEDSTQIGSDSSVLSLNTWYRIELKVDCTTIASTAIEAKIDGVAFASDTVNLAAGIDKFRLSATTSDATLDVWFDDIAINDDSGSFQNSYPDEGEIIHLRPNAAGDAGNWADGTGATFAEVDEVTPDDITTYIDTPDVNLVSEFNLAATPAALASDDTISCVHVGVRYAQESAGTTARINVRIRAVSAGTVEESGNITQTNNTNWNTNNSAAPRNYPLTLYDLPGASTTSWTKNDLDTTQIGVKRTVDDGLNSSRVSTLWLLVDHKPAAGGGGGSIPDWPIFTGKRFWGPRYS